MKPVTIKKIKDELHYIERAYIELLKPSLNCTTPMRTQKEYRQNNKEAIKQKANEKFSCECGGCYTTTNKARHIKTKKHLNFINQ